MTPHINSEEFSNALRSIGLSEQQILEARLAHCIQLVLTAMLLQGSKTGVQEFDLSTLKATLLEKHSHFSNEEVAFILEIGLSSCVSFGLIKVVDDKYLLTMEGKMTAISVLRQLHEIEEANHQRTNIEEN